MACNASEKRHAYEPAFLYALEGRLHKKPLASCRLYHGMVAARAHPSRYNIINLFREKYKICVLFYTVAAEDTMTNSPMSV
jgi:hypothetical protein